MVSPIGSSRAAQGLPLLLHLHHVHQGPVGRGEDPGRVCPGVPSAPRGGIRRFPGPSPPTQTQERCILDGTLTVNYEQVDTEYRLRHNDLLANIVHR